MGDRDWRILGELLPRLWADPDTRMDLILVVFLLLATAAFNAAVPVLYKDLVDHFVVSPAVIPVLLVVAYIIAQSVAKVCGDLRWRYYGRIEQRIRRNMALRLFDHVHGLSLRYHLERRTGALQQIVENGILGYCIILQNFLYVMVPLVFELALIGGVIAALGKPFYLAVLMVTAILYIIATIRVIEKQRLLQREAAAAQIEAAAVTIDSYLNYETIKYFDGGSMVRDRLDRSLKRSEDGWTGYYYRRTLTGLTQTLCQTLGLAAILVLAVLDLANGSLTVGGFVLVVSYFLQIMRPVESFGLAYREIMTGLTFVKQVEELLRERSEVRNMPGAKILPPGRGEVLFDRVDFAYEPDLPILREVSFRIPPGRTLAVVGPSGAGKSTLSRLLFRSMMSGGHVAIDGHRLSELSLESVRESMAVVPQDTVLFNDTLAFNRGIARPGCSLEEIREGARLAGIAGLIDSLPDG